MKAFTLAIATALLASSAFAAPAAKAARQFEAQITFHGATPEDTFTQSVPTDGSTFYVYDKSSITSISSAGGATCTFFGVDGSVTTVVGAQTVPVGPPQVQLTGSCLAL